MDNSQEEILGLRKAALMMKRAEQVEFPKISKDGILLRIFTVLKKKFGSPVDVGTLLQAGYPADYESAVETGTLDSLLNGFGVHVHRLHEILDNNNSGLEIYSFPSFKKYVMLPKLNEGENWPLQLTDELATGVLKEYYSRLMNTIIVGQNRRLVPLVSVPQRKILSLMKDLAIGEQLATSLVDSTFADADYIVSSDQMYPLKVRRLRAVYINGLNETMKEMGIPFHIFTDKNTASISFRELP